MSNFEAICSLQFHEAHTQRQLGGSGMQGYRSISVEGSNSFDGVPLTKNIGFFLHR